MGRVGKAGDVSICFPFQKKIPKKNHKNRDRERETAIIVLTTEKITL